MSVLDSEKVNETASQSGGQNLSSSTEEKAAEASDIRSRKQREPNRSHSSTDVPEKERSLRTVFSHCKCLKAPRPSYHAFI